jgi:(p)ppGpp synthase/HD superfamily hydrolase
MSSIATRSSTQAGDGDPEVVGERFADAVAYATRVHQGQSRRGAPYIAHLLRVAGLVLEDGGSEDEAIAALLHDAAEDPGGRPRLTDIRGRYGDEVAAIVDSCTDSYEQPAPPWRVRKERYLKHLPDSSPGALLVSLADKVDNVRAILGESGNGQTAVDRADACWYYTSLARLFGQLRPGARADELAAMADELRRRSRRGRQSSQAPRSAVGQSSMPSASRRSNA